MIPIRYNDKIGRSLDDICDEILSKCSKNKLSTLDNWCKNNIILNGKSYKYRDIMIADYPTLVKIQTLSSIQKHKKHLEAQINAKKADPLSTYLIGTLYEKHVKEIKDELVEKLEISVCPYCNRTFIDSVHNRRTYQLDHFFNKYEYPIFAASFYNLVPCCYGCNYIKRKETFSYSPYNPDFIHANELTDFDIDISNMDYIRNKDHFKIVIEADPIMDQNIKLIKMEDLYSLHKNDVLEIIRRRKIYPEGYVNNIFNQYKDLFSSKEEAEHIVYGYALDEEIFKHEPLSKMRSDIGRYNGGPYADNSSGI